MNIKLQGKSRKVFSSHLVLRLGVSLAQTVQDSGQSIHGEGGVGGAGQESPDCHTSCHE